MKLRNDIDMQWAVEQLAGLRDSEELAGLLRQAKTHLPEALYFDLEDAINAHAGEAFDRAFIGGWRAAKQPELLIFTEIGVVEQML